MRILLFVLLLAVASCRRPSSQIKSTLTPVNTPTELPDYSRYLKAGDEVVALGNEPSWSLTINPSKNIVRFKTPDGDAITTPIPDQTTDPTGGFRYSAEVESGRIAIIFRPDSCVDAMSGQRFDYRVDITVGGKSYTGCGVSLRQVALLEDIWVLTELNGKTIPVTGRERPRLEFMLTEGRVSGTTGCNRLSGSVKADTRQIQFGPLATTRMACPDDSSHLEADFLKGLQAKPLRYQVGGGKLTLLSNNVSLMSFKKVD
jgi:heat shock protein HslJ/uncharacterized membrane protein